MPFRNVIKSCTRPDIASLVARKFRCCFVIIFITFCKYVYAHDKWPVNQEKKMGSLLRLPCKWNSLNLLSSYSCDIFFFGSCTFLISHERSTFIFLFILRTHSWIKVICHFSTISDFPGGGDDDHFRFRTSDSPSRRSCPLR